MRPFLDNVDGCALRMHEIYTTVSFTTESDALFASFFAKYKTTDLALFDDILSVLNHPRFRSQDLTMKNATDVMNQISKQRQVVAGNRAGVFSTMNVATVDTCNIGTIPMLVVELVSEHVYSERAPFHRTISQGMTGVRLDCEADRILRSMSLVHRSWTTIAQRYLHRRVYISGAHNMRLSLEGAQLGPWVCELAIDSYKLLNRPMIEQDEVTRMTHDIIVMCPNLKALYLTSMLADYGFCLMGMFDRLGELTRLENLWLHRFGGEPSEGFSDGLWRLCKLLPRLHALKSLSLDGCSLVSSASLGLLNLNDDHFEDRFRSFLEDNTPSPTLRFLSLGGPCYIDVTQDEGRGLDTLELVALAWLLKSRGKYAPISLGIARSFDHDCYQHVLENSRPQITRLVCTGQQPRFEVFPALQSLCLTSTWGSRFHSLVLPQTIQHLQLHYNNPGFPHHYDEEFIAEVRAALSTEAVPNNYEYHDIYGFIEIVEILEASPSVKNVLVTWCNSEYTAEKVLKERIDGVDRMFKAFDKFCERKDIEFQWKALQYEPTFLDPY